MTMVRFVSEAGPFQLLEVGGLFAKNISESCFNLKEKYDDNPKLQVFTNETKLITFLMICNHL